MTQAIVEITEPLGIAVHDHIIVGIEGHASLQGAAADLGWRSRAPSNIPSTSTSINPPRTSTCR
jgi:hypothetical protein